MEELTAGDSMSLPSDIDDDLCNSGSRGVTVHQTRSCMGTADQGQSRGQERDGRYFAKPHIFVRPSTELQQQQQQQQQQQLHSLPHQDSRVHDVPDVDGLDCGGGGGGGVGGGEVILISSERSSNTHPAPLPPAPPLTRPPPAPTSTTATTSPFRHAYSTPDHAHPSPDHAHYAALPAFRSNEHAGTANGAGGLLTATVSGLAALLLAAAVFSTCYYYARFSAPVSAAVAVVGAWIPLTFALCTSIACRSVNHVFNTFLSCDTYSIYIYIYIYININEII